MSRASDASEVVSLPYTIVGAGAIGGILGAHLIEAGCDVTFVEENREHVEAISSSGLRVSGARDLTVSARAVTPDEVSGPLGRVLLAVKSRHTEQALATIGPLLAPNGYVVSLQNGLEEYKIARAVGEGRTIGAFLTFGGHYLKPGEVVYGGSGSFRTGELDGERTERIERLRDDLSALQNVELTGNIFGFLWAKMALGAIYFATALVSEDVPDQMEDRRYRSLFANLAGEVVAVAAAAGVELESFDGFDPQVFRFGKPRESREADAAWAAQRAYWLRHSQRRTGVWRDLSIHKRPTEVHGLVGAVMGVAEEQGVPVPRLHGLVRLVQGVERGELELGRHNLETLIAIDQEAAEQGRPPSPPSLSEGSGQG
ncbi:MAG: 2-dehydropantoate 2-reductase [Trueperaceae bacterium]